MDERRLQFNVAALRMAQKQGDPGVNLKEMMEPIYADLSEVLTRYGEAGVPYCLAGLEMIAEGLRAQSSNEVCRAADAVKTLGSTTVINIRGGAEPWNVSCADAALRSFVVGSTSRRSPAA